MARKKQKNHSKKSNREKYNTNTTSLLKNILESIKYLRSWQFTQVENLRDILNKMEKSDLDITYLLSSNILSKTAQEEVRNLLSQQRLEIKNLYKNLKDIEENEKALNDLALKGADIYTQAENLFNHEAEENITLEKLYERIKGMFIHDSMQEGMSLTDMTEAFERNEEMFYSEFLDFMNDFLLGAILFNITSNISDDNYGLMYLLLFYWKP